MSNNLLTCVRHSFSRVTGMKLASRCCRGLLLVTLLLTAVRSYGVPMAITYTDAAGTGFFDNTARTPIGGNTGTTLGQQRRNVLEAVANRWGQTLEGNQTIQIQAHWLGQGSSILASASPLGFSFNFAGAPVANVAYPYPLANQLAGTDLDPASADILVNCNSDWDAGVNAPDLRKWYYGFDGARSGQDFDFYSTMLHEMAHGLGYISWLNQNGSYQNNKPTIYDTFLINSIGQGLVSLTQAERASAAISSNLFFIGAYAKLQNTNVPPHIHSPPVWQPGSSISHLDEVTYSIPQGINEMQTPVSSFPTHNVGTLVPGIFEDIGWKFYDNDPGSVGTVSITTPAAAQRTNFLAGAGTAADLLNGVTPGAIGLGEVHLAFRRVADGSYWNWNLGAFDDTTFNTATHRLNAGVTVVPINTGTLSWTSTLPGGVPDGAYQLSVSTVDLFGNETAYASVSFTKDTQPPVLTFAPLTNSQTVFDFAGLGGTISEAGTVTFRIDQFDAISNSHAYWNGSSWIADGNSPAVFLAGQVSGNNWLRAPGVTLPSRAQARAGQYLLRAIGADLTGNATTNDIAVNRSPADTTTPNATLDSITQGQTFTNAVLPGIFGTAFDLETGISSVNVFLMRATNPGYVYWTGASWDVNPTSLPANYNAGNGTWTLNTALPSGGNLINATYQAQVGVANNEAPMGTRVISANFSVDYHPVYTFTAGSYFDNIPGNENMLWSNPINWDVGQVPPVDSVVVINNFSPDNTGLGSVSLYRLDMSGGTLTTSGMLIQKLNLSGGILSGGAITMATNGVFNWSGGTIAGIITVPGGIAFNISGAGDKILSHDSTLNLAGNATWAGAGNLNAGYNTVFNNSGTFSIQGDAQFYNNTGGSPIPVFNNNGIVQKTNATGLTIISAANGGWIFNNSGTLDIGSGVLSSQNQFFLKSGSILTGAGVTRVDSGTAFFMGTNTLNNGGTLEVAGGNMDGTNTLAGTGAFDWSGGSIAAALTLQSNIAFNISGAAAKTLAQNAVINSTGNGTWTGTG
ncbi:MAG: hypothetical protein JWR19_2052, partial [Pedosphaera sp.]|nr:hypothetical protein [Pedosphaera sp.]